MNDAPPHNNPLPQSPTEDTHMSNDWHSPIHSPTAQEEGYAPFDQRTHDNEPLRKLTFETHTSDYNEESAPQTLTPKANPLPNAAATAAQRSFDEQHKRGDRYINHEDDENYDSPPPAETQLGFEQEDINLSDVDVDDWELLDKEADRLRQGVDMRKILEDEDKEEDEARQEEVDDPIISRWVPQPPKGWPFIYGETPTYPYSNLHPAQRDEIMMEEGAHNLMILVFGENSWEEPKCNTIAGSIAEELCDYLNIEEVIVFPALPRNTPRLRNDPPWVYYVTGLDQENATRLKDRHILASRMIQMQILPTIYFGPTGYGGTIEGLIATNLKNFTEVKRDLLLRDIRSILFKHKGTHDTIMTYLLAIQPVGNAQVDITQYDQCVEKFLLSDLKVKILQTKTGGNTPAPAINMYFRLDTNKDMHRRSLLTQLLSVSYSTSRFGVGRYNPGWKCHSCRGVDHPSGLCPFRNISHWEDIVNPSPPPPPADDQDSKSAGPSNAQKGTSRGAYRGTGRGVGTNAGRGSGTSTGRGANVGRGQTQKGRGGRGSNA